VSECAFLDCAPQCGRMPSLPPYFAILLTLYPFILYKQTLMTTAHTIIRMTMGPSTTVQEMDMLVTLRRSVKSRRRTMAIP
jgi:hypothetical protein